MTKLNAILNVIARRRRLHSKSSKEQIDYFLFIQGV